MKARIVIFGGTGDLTYRKLMPALYNLFVRGVIGEDSDIAAIGRRDYTDAAYREIVMPWIREFARIGRQGERLAEFLDSVHYLRLDFTDPSQFRRLQEYGEAQRPAGPALVYLAVAPQFFAAIAQGVSKLPSLKGSRIILEKPFGETLAGANALSQALEASFGPENIYRIDHYLGKEMVRNILAIRGANRLFEKVWDRGSLASVQISALEEVGVETRGGYYDEAGALKDMVQNHLLAILTIIALEDPSGSLPDQQLAVLRHLRPIRDIGGAMVLGQYAGYRAEDKVAPDSATETYAALKLYVDTERWRDVPFFIRTGKKCGTRRIEAVLTFRRSDEDSEPDRLVIEIQPAEGLFLEFNVKKPGEEPGTERVRLEYCQSCSPVFRLNTPEAYERMLAAAFRGDQSWFGRWDLIEAGWRFIEQARDAYAAAGLPVYPYAPGSPGPREAAALTQGQDRWRDFGDPGE